MAGAVFFTTASLLCGLAWSAGGTAGGPLVGGPCWRWIFFINVPIGLAALALPPVLLRESRAALTRRSHDPAGALTSPARWSRSSEHQAPTGATYGQSCRSPARPCWLTRYQEALQRSARPLVGTAGHCGSAALWSCGTYPSWPGKICSACLAGEYRAATIRAGRRGSRRPAACPFARQPCSGTARCRSDTPDIARPGQPGDHRLPGLSTTQATAPASLRPLPGQEVIDMIGDDFEGSSSGTWATDEFRYLAT
jgi:hypothetical protein